MGKIANIIFDRKEIEKYVKLTDEVVKKIDMMGVPVEKLEEDSLEVQILPNRPDLLSLQGFVRSLRAFLGKETGLKKYTVKQPEKNYKVKIDSSVKNVRPYTTCAIVKGLSLDDAKIKALIDIQEKIHTTLGRNRRKAAIGIYPLEKISLPIKYEARKPSDISFIPLESDKEMNGLQILQKHPKGREYAHLLEGFQKYPVFSDAKNNILSLPPIINSHLTGKITEKTKDVFIECSGSNFEVLEKILNILVTTFAEMGGKIYAMELDYGKKIVTPDLSPKKMKLLLDNVNDLLGLDLKEKDLEKLLPKMEYDYKSKSVSIPPWRTDILHEVDIIEDIAIAYGYDKIVPEIPKIGTIAEESSESKLRKQVSEILVGLGILEVSSYHLIKKDEAKTALLKNTIEVSSSKTEYKILRPNLQIPVFRIFSENKDNEYPQNIFEIGTVFERDPKNQETGIQETTNLAIALSPGSFTNIKQTLDYLISQLGLQYSIQATKKHGLIEGRTAEIIINGKSIGFCGEIHPDTLRNWNCKLPVVYLEISLNSLLNN